MMFVSRIYLIVVALFLLFGNAPRFLPLPTNFGSANLGELCLYISTTGYILFCLFSGKINRKNTFGYCFSAATLFSLCIGLIKWGPDSSAIFYNIRYVMQLLSGVAVGIAAAACYQDDAPRLATHLVRTYVIASALAFLLFLAFPESAVLWQTLEDMGVNYEGDPHIGRLVSLYFDPNYFGTIIVLPILLTFVPDRSRIEMLAWLGVFLFCLFLTASRSGISTFLIMGGYIGSLYFFRLRATGMVSKSTALQFAGAMLVLCCGFLASLNYIITVLERFTSVSSDASAKYRFESFSIGNKLILEEPIFGYGYNYGFDVVRQYRGIGLDSSLQTLALNFGLPLFLAMAGCTLIWAKNRFRDLQRRNAPKQLRKLWHLTWVYFLSCMLWAGNFNQLLFYPFWIIPIVAIFSYVEIRASKTALD